VKTEFGKFGEVLAKVKKQLDTASNTIDKTATRTNVMARKLKGVEGLPSSVAQEVLNLPAGDPAGEMEETDEQLLDEELETRV
jgi:DNA recombination protein RmuC